MTVNIPPQSVTVCLATFRRETVEATIHSLAAQVLPKNVTLEVIVCDNDETPSARSRIQTLAAQVKVPIRYVHAPKRNISVARNAGLNAANGDWVAFIDDDEIAPKDWIATLYNCAITHGHDIVFGPAYAHYPPGAPQWISSIDYHSNIPHDRGGVVQTGHTCNALMRRTAPMIEGERFLLEKGRTGGEDTEFFFRLWKAGAKLGICREAEVHETVEPSRLSFKWLLKRKFRSGITYGKHALVKPGLMARLQLVILAFAKIIYCGLRSAAAVFSQTSRNFWALRAIFHCGVASTGFKIREQELY